MWERLGLGAEVNGLLDGLGYGFALERAVFVSVLHRLFFCGSDRSCDKLDERLRHPNRRPREFHARSADENAHSLHARIRVTVHVDP